MRLARAFSAVHTRVSFSFDLTFTPLPVAHSLTHTQPLAQLNSRFYLIMYLTLEFTKNLYMKTVFGDVESIAKKDWVSVACPSAF